MKDKLRNMNEDWVECEADLLGYLIRGINYKKPQSSDKILDNYLPILRANNINENKLNFINLKYVEEQLINNEQKILAGDIIFAMSSGSKHLVGKSAQAKDDYNGSFGAFCSAFRPNQNVNKYFIQFYFHSATFRGIISKASKGSNINNLKREHILNAVIPLPPLPIQRAIVSKIETLFSDLDAGVANLKKAQEQLKIYRQAVLKKAFDLDAKKYKIEEICKDIFAGGDKPKDFFSKTKTEKNSIPILANAVANNGLYGYTNIARVVEPAITIAGRGSGTGHVELRKEPFFPIVRLITIIPNSEIVDIEFLVYFLKNLNIKGSGSAIPQLTIPMVKIFKIHLPSIQEQHQIVQEIETRLSVCDKVAQSISESLEKAKALRQSILKKAFEGKLLSQEEIAACKQEADYEPASVLLEKIKAEKEKKEQEAKKLKTKKGKRK